MNNSGKQIAKLLPGCRITTKFCDLEFRYLLQVALDVYVRFVVFCCTFCCKYVFVVLVAKNFVIRFSFPLLSI